MRHLRRWLLCTERGPNRHTHAARCQRSPERRLQPHREQDGQELRITKQVQRNISAQCPHRPAGRLRLLNGTVGEGEGWEEVAMRLEIDIPAPQQSLLHSLWTT